MNPPLVAAPSDDASVTPPATERATDFIEEAGLALAAGELEQARALLEPGTRDADRPAWVRQALAAAVDLLDGALDGGPDSQQDGAADGRVGDRGDARRDRPAAITRVGALLDLTRSAAPDGATPEPGVATLPDETIRELLPEFLAESAEHLDHVEALLMRSDGAADSTANGPIETEALQDIFRAFHTIKGSAAFLGVGPVAEFAHAGESLLDRLRTDPQYAGPAAAGLVLECVDVLRRLLGDVASPSDPGSPPSLAASGGSHPAATPGRPRLGPHAPTVRVRTDRLDELADLVGELVVAHAMVAGDPVVHGLRHDALGRNVGRAGKILRQLQDLASALRMVPLRPVFQRMERLVRDLSAETGKSVEFVGEGADTEIDRHMVDLLADPLVHMIRNAVDHGVETAESRAAAGKSARARIRLSAWHAGGEVVVEVGDDGRGLDVPRIRANAVAYGKAVPDRPLTPEEAASLIFESGLSTAEAVTALSGRGVGMDVVRRNIEALRGRIEVRTEEGLGTTFRIRLPLTLAVTDGMLVRVGGERYIVPSADIRTCCRPDAEAYARVAGGGELVTWHGANFPLVRMHALFDVADAVTDPTQGVLVVVSDGMRQCGLLIDEVLGQHQFVARPVAAALGVVSGVGGTAILGDGQVGLILDVAGLLAAR